MNITSRQLKAFVLTARHQSFSRAAEQLFITQSGMSLLVRELETQLGFRLFERTTRKVALTELGARFLPVADRSLRELEAAAATLSRSAAPAHASLLLGGGPFCAAAILPRAISAYAQLDPRLHIDLIDAERAKLREQLQAGAIDAAVLTGLQDEAPGLRQRSLARFAMMLVSPAAGEPRLPAELRWPEVAALRLVGLPRATPIQQLVDEQLARAGRGAPAEVTCNFFETQIAMVEAGAGAAVMPAAASLACAKRNVTLHAIVEPVVWTDVCWVSSGARELPRAAAQFCEFLSEYLAHIAERAPRAAAEIA
ncbi:MAG TPA: LysR family transcriptional regulator [Burkholderiales bacterium]